MFYNLSKNDYKYEININFLKISLSNVPSCPESKFIFILHKLSNRDAAAIKSRIPPIFTSYSISIHSHQQYTHLSKLFQESPRRRTHVTPKKGSRYERKKSLVFYSSNRSPSGCL